LVTFGNPGKTSLKTSFQEFIPLHHAIRHGSPNGPSLPATKIPDESRALGGGSFNFEFISK
jgi:hypothetical protein